MYRNNRFSYIEKNGMRDFQKEYCNRIINVTFEYSVKEFNRTGDNIFLKLGCQLNDVVWKDCVGYFNETICAVKINCNLTEPPISELPKCFYVQDNQYKVKTNIKNIACVADVRKRLYKDGFTCNGVHYVRWKRSSGSARLGKCLFIDENLYDRMHNWEMCGLKYKDSDKVDLAGLESYISLTSSSIIDILKIQPKNILVIDDFESVFFEDVINVTEENNMLLAKPEKTKIVNSIFDGESLIDISLMGNYQNKGMLLLRNRFFKSCCFNTNIQKWFKDNHITSVTQLNGFTLATNVEDVKLITTPSSIKYLKYGKLEKWLSLIEDNFGIVKYEKPTHFMDGQLVQTHYQLINTVQMSYDEVNELLRSTFDFMTLIKNNPAVLRYWIKFKIEDEIEVTPVKSKTDVIYKMMSVNQDFYKTKLYYDFKTDFLKSFTKDLKCGHVLVNGNYSTLCGNPIEMLMSAIGTFNGNRIVEKRCVFSKRFEWDKALLGSRSPHPTISNVLLIKNKYNKQIDTYMNSTNEIVYVNSIGENLLQQLAGADYDSDSILLTDNQTLINAAMRNDGKFKVAVCNVSGTKRKRKLDYLDKSDLDIKTSNNLIGDIINLAQELNTRIWDKLYCGASLDDVMGLYLDTCKLSILSGIEIDKAKKEFTIDCGKELRSIRQKHKILLEQKYVKPKFFAHISKQKGYYSPDKKAYIKHHTAMDYLQQCVNSYNHRSYREGNKSYISFSSILNKSYFHYDRVKDKQIVDVLNRVDSLNRAISKIYMNPNKSSLEKNNEVKIMRQSFVEQIGKEKFDYSTMIALLIAIEKPENRKYKRLLFYTLFGYPNTSFYNVILHSKTTLANDTSGISLFGIKI